MSMKQVAEDNRLKWKKDACGEVIVPGKYGHIFHYGGGLLGAVLEDTPDGKWGTTLRSRRKKMLAAGFELRQAGNYESVLAFSPEKLKLAVKLVGAKRKRLAPPETARRMVKTAL